MTSASELFNNWRSRAARIQAPEPAALISLSSDRHPDLRHPRRRLGRLRHYRDGCDTSRRSHPDPNPPPPQSRHFYHRSSYSDREQVCLQNRIVGVSGTGNRGNGGSAGARVDQLRLNRNNQLPGVVVQARARLLQRLRGISLSENSQSTAASGVSWNEITTGDDFSVINYGDLETETPGEWFEESVSSFTNLTVELDEDHQNLSGKKPPGLNSEALCELQIEVFKDGFAADNLVKASPDCSICLERFWEGDELIRLSCQHIFHRACLEPWVRACGDCPYCRRRI